MCTVQCPSYDTARILHLKLSNAAFRSFAQGQQLEVISTGYILIESGKTTAVQRVTNTLPLNRTDLDAITNTAKAGELLGKKLIYLEAGSGATYEVPAEVISSVKNKIYGSSRSR